MTDSGQSTEVPAKPSLFNYIHSSVYKYPQPFVLLAETESWLKLKAKSVLPDIFKVFDEIQGYAMVHQSL